MYFHITSKINSDKLSAEFLDALSELARIDLSICEAALVLKCFSIYILKDLTPFDNFCHELNILWGAIHQLLSIILKLRILVLLPVSTMPYVVIAKNYS
jgi:hypothetical protein